MHLLSNRIQKTPTRKTKSSREQESSGDKLVTRSGVLHETKKVCVEHLASCCTVFYPRGQDRCCSDFPSQTYLRAQLSPMHAVQKPSLVSLVLLPLPDIPVVALCVDSVRQLFTSTCHFILFVGRDGAETPLPLVVRDGVAGKGGLAASPRVIRGTGRIPGGVHLRRG